MSMFKKNKVRSKSPRYDYEYSVPKSGWIPDMMILDTEHLGKIKIDWTDPMLTTAEGNSGVAFWMVGSIELEISYHVKGDRDRDILDWDITMTYVASKTTNPLYRETQLVIDSEFTLRDWMKFQEHLSSLVDSLYEEIFQKLGSNVVSESKKKKRKGSSKDVAYTRHGTNDVALFTYGSGDSTGSRKKEKTVWVTTKSGDKYEIPVDSKGYVPKEVILQRFLDESQGGTDGRERSCMRDIQHDADVIHDLGKGVTPEEIIRTGWWQHPNESDILGVDDTSVNYFEEIATAAKSAQYTGKKMAMLMPPSSAEKVRKVLGDNFTAKELKDAVRGGGLVITEGNTGKGVAGYYRGKMDGNDTPLIKLCPGAGADTITHEFVHHLRRVDESRGGVTRTPMKLDEGNLLNRKFLYSKEWDSAVNLEEAATVAETTARTRKRTQHPTGYYEDIKGDGTMHSRYHKDRDTLVGKVDVEKPLRGKRAIKKVDKEFENLEIAKLRTKRNGMRADNYLAERKAKNDLPIAKVKKKSAPKKKGSKVDYTRPVGTPVAVAANKKQYRRKR